MNRYYLQHAAFSKVSTKSTTVLPREVCQHLKLKPGDTLRYRMTNEGILLDKPTETGDDPFAALCEWDSEGLWRVVAKSFSVRDGELEKQLLVTGLLRDIRGAYHIREAGL
jgi:antitoxin PrlF